MTPVLSGDRLIQEVVDSSHRFKGGEACMPMKRPCVGCTLTAYTEMASGVDGSPEMVSFIGLYKARYFVLATLQRKRQECRTKRSRGNMELVSHAKTGLEWGDGGMMAARASNTQHNRARSGEYRKGAPAAAQKPAMQ